MESVSNTFCGLIEVSLRNLVELLPITLELLAGVLFRLNAVIEDCNSDSCRVTCFIYKQEVVLLRLGTNGHSFESLCSELLRFIQLSEN